MYKVYISLIFTNICSLSAPLLIFFFFFSHLGVCEVVCHCDFDLYFPSD